MRSLGVAMGDCFVFLLTALEKGKLGSGWMTEKLYIWMVQLRRSDKQKLSSSTETWLPLKSPLSFTTTKDIWQLEKTCEFFLPDLRFQCLGMAFPNLDHGTMVLFIDMQGRRPGMRSLLATTRRCFFRFFRVPESQALKFLPLFPPVKGSHVSNPIFIISGVSGILRKTLL